MKTRHLVGLTCLLLLACSVWVVGCRTAEHRLSPDSNTWAELVVVRNSVQVASPGGKRRQPFPRERLVDGASVRLEEGGLAFWRLDSGTTLLVRGPGLLEQHPRSVEVKSGRLFVDAPAGASTEVVTPKATLLLNAVRASVDVSPEGALFAYLLSGELRVGALRARAGEALVWKGDKPSVQAVRSWEDWTGGLATTDRAPEPAPFGIGTIGARRPSDQGSPRFPLAIQKLDVRVTVQDQFATTEVDQIFFNPSSETVEGLFSFRTPPSATLERFGVDRNGRMAFGHVKERASAATQYESNVYQGSTEDPALLEWDAPGVYRARLYPIAAGETRRIMVRYTEWLSRSGSAGERRLYVYPMAAEGAESALPHIEDFTFVMDLSKAGAQRVRSGMAGVRRGQQVLIRAQDLVPRADLAIELFDKGSTGFVAYRAPHRPDLDILPLKERDAAQASAAQQPDYLLFALRPRDLSRPPGGLDLAVVIDASAATQTGALALARAASESLLTHLGSKDRVAIWTGADGLLPLSGGRGLTAVDEAVRRRVRMALAAVEPGGATDLGKMLTEATAALDPKRQGAVVYLGDGRPTVGELSLEGLRRRLDKLPHPARIYALGMGTDADLATLTGLTKGGFAERVKDGQGAAQAALRVLGHLERPVWLDRDVDLGTSVERIVPRGSAAWVADEDLLFVGRATGSADPESIRVRGPNGTNTHKLQVRRFTDRGDLRRRWGMGRLTELLADQAGPAALVDLGMRQGLITPVTSLYVPTAREMAEQYAVASETTEEPSSSQPGLFSRLFGAKSEEASAPAMFMGRADEAAADNKEGGTGTRAKGEEGSMGNPASKVSSKRYAVQGPRDSAPERPRLARAAAASEAQGFGMIGAVGGGTAPAGLGLSASAPALAKPAAPLGSGTGQGFGSGHGRLGASHQTRVPRVRIGAFTTSGALPVEMTNRVVRQSYGRYRLCYEGGLRRNPNLQGRVAGRFTIRPEGSVADVANAGSDLPDAGVVACILKAFSGLAFPASEGGTTTVVVPIQLEPGETETGASSDSESVETTNGLVASLLVRTLPRVPLSCGPAAALPLADRVALWTERLEAQKDCTGCAAAVYVSALDNCEAMSPPERYRLLGLMLDSMSSVENQVALWRVMKHQLGTGDYLYRGILARVKTPEQMRQLYDALGVARVDPGILRKSLTGKTPTQRVAFLRGQLQLYPDDLWLAVRVLEALEDAEDWSALHEMLRELRRRTDADAAVRTAVGEMYLRLAQRPVPVTVQAAFHLEARRAFGEIVEFAPADPVARRRLGDLLRAHGWYSEARRQYETLAELVPDDPTAALRLAAAAQGEGRLEEAVRWTEKGLLAGAPDAAQGPAVTARALAAAFLSWGRMDARRATKKDELTRLLGRSQRLLGRDVRAGEARIILTWEHPDLFLTLWTNALGAPMPASRGDASLGIYEAHLVPRSTALVEVRLEPEEQQAARRLGARAWLTVIFDELLPSEKILRIPIDFRAETEPTIRFSLSGKELSRG